MATKTRELADFILEEGIGGDADIAIQGEPHIRPGVLYPAVANIMVDGSTALSASTVGPNSSTVTTSKYGTVQSDGRMYYYTDIKGSKPIKDPRIGGHFGSQRHKFKSLQVLEQETATHGFKCFSVDGREWIRISATASIDIEMKNDDGGVHIKLGNATDFIEITGYLNDINILLYTHANYLAYTKQLNGAAASASGHSATATSPLDGRYVDNASLLNVGVGATLGINTVRINSHNNNIYCYGIELIAQDTSSDANKVKVQIPSQNVVSYGKKFSVSGTPHYDPFNGMSGAKTLSELGTYIDTATSLGMDNWKGGTSNYYKPFNGGRVVKWVASDGTIKTSVTMMPPNAQNYEGTASNAVSDAHIQAGTNDDVVNFNTSAIDLSLSEVAKTFHWREFGNGAANGGNQATYADMTMLDTTSDLVAYFMDDGLTSMSADGLRNWSSGATGSPSLLNQKKQYFTFIGTGISLKRLSFGNAAGLPDGHWAQNLSYGTHIMECRRYDNPGSLDRVRIDGVIIKDNISTTNGYIGSKDWTIHQPKMPPIPDDACIIADYMLMADHVVQTSVNNEEISKGVRLCSASRDHFTDSSGSITSVENRPDLQMFGLSGHMSPSSTHGSTTKLPFFGTNAQCWIQGAADVAHTVAVGGVGKTEINHNHSSGDSARDAITIADSEKVTLGMTDITTTVLTGSYRFWATAVASPTHTSHHYQTFETEFSTELIGGDRNMEQTNLVVTADGKTWDEVTRDTSYIGNEVLNVMATTGNSAGGHLTPNGCRGLKTNRHGYNFWKSDYCTWMYDRMLFVKDGTYRITREIKIVDSYSQSRLFHNGSGQSNIVLQIGPNSEGTWEWWHGSVVLKINRGEYIIVEGYNSGSAPGDGFYIERIEK